MSTDTDIPAVAPFVYQATHINTVDGDTHDLTIDLGFRIQFDRRVRLAAVDTAEINIADDDERERGFEQRDFATAWFEDAREDYDGDWPLVVSTQQDRTGKYGRYLATIQRKSDGAILSQSLIDEFGDDIRYEG